MERKPTAAQILTLKSIKDGRVAQNRYGYGAWRIDGATPQVVGRCISQGWARWGKSDGDTMLCYLTDAGTAVLMNANSGNGTNG